MKKLIPALCMLLVAAALMGTSTYAWFTMNTEVKATGMNVTAATPSSLYIDTDAGMANKSFSKAATNTSKLALLPASTVLPTTATAPTFYKALAKTSDNFAVNSADATPYSVATNPGDLAENQYYRLDTYYVQNVDAGFNNFGVQAITVVPDGTATNTTLMNAIRVLVVVTNTKDSSFGGAKMYATVGAADDSNNGVNGTGKENVAPQTFLGSTNAATTAICNLVENDIYKVDVYTYLDGEDDACTSNNSNALTLTGIEIQIQFGACPAA